MRLLVQKQSRSMHAGSLRRCPMERLRAAAEGQQTQGKQEESEEALTDKMAEFLRKQAEKESGGQLAVVEEPAKEVLGADVVSDEEAKKYCREVMSAVKQLREKRDMSINEIKLTLAIEDPTAREKRDYLGIEEGAGVSRDEVAAALLTVNAGKIPLDRLALKELVNEVRMWPFLDADDELKAEQEAVSNYEGITDTGAPKKKGTGVARPPIGRDKEEAPQGISDMLPEWMGYGFLYFVSTIPVLIVIVTISILFFSSLS